MNRRTCKNGISVRRCVRGLLLLALAAMLIAQSMLPALCAGAPSYPGAYGRRNGSLAVDPIGHTEGYSAVLYDNTNGLPTSEANAIAETSEGFLWIGSYSGLIRYDGNTFERMDSSTGITSVKCLFVDARDRLWIGTNDNGLFLMENGSFRRWGEEDGLKALSIRAIVEDDSGTIYLATTGGLAMVDAALELHASDDPRVSDVYVHDLRTSLDGHIYGLTNDGDVFSLFDGRVDAFFDHDQSRFHGISCIMPDSRNLGYFYFEDKAANIYYGSPDDSFESAKRINIDPLSYVQEFRVIDGKVWICARNGIGVLDDDGFHPLDNLPMNNSVGHVAVDYEGNLWFTSSRQGVMKIVPNRFTNVFQTHDLTEQVVNTTSMCGGKLFIGTDTGLIVLNEDGRLSNLPLQEAKSVSGKSLDSKNMIELLDGCRIRSIIRDSRDRLWISTWRKYGLIRYASGKATVFSVDDGLCSDHVRAVCERADGSILAACTGGVNVIEGDEITASYGEEAGITNTEVLTVAEGTDGDILLGTDGGGIFIIRDGQAKHIGTEEGLSSGVVMRIKRDRTRDIYWIVTGNSIAWMTPDYQLTTLAKFPYSNNFDLYENSKDEMWILSSNGIYVLSVDELLEQTDPDPIHFGISNGLPCIATANSYSELTPDGDLYIAGTAGVTKVNIEKPLDAVSSLKLAVPYVDADGERIYPDESGQFVLDSNVQKLTIYAYVFNHSLINPQVTYCLYGFDRQSVTVSRRELMPVDYTNLPGGTYTFTVQLNDPLGRGDNRCSVEIAKERAIYENLWFYLLAFMLTIAAASVAVGAYVRRRIRALEQKHREETNRQRIVTELSMASRIQNSMLPHTTFPDRNEFDIYASMDPAKEVGGDFYDYFLIDDDHLCLVMADVSGKGIPAALFMMISKVILQSCAMLGRAPAEILTKTNEALCSDNQVDMFVTVWLGILEISTGKLTAANAGHEYPVLCRQGNFALLKDKHGFVIGGMEGMKYKEYEVDLAPGDKLFLYTDGVPEATDAENQMFGTERMLAALNEAPEAAPEQILNNVRKAVDDFVKEAEQFDDLTMLCLEYRGAAEPPPGSPSAAG